MADKDVNLIIKARDSASAAIAKVDESLKDFKATAKDASGSAREIDSAFAALGDEFKKLSAEINALKSVGAITASLDRAAQAVNRLENQSRQSAAELSANARAASDASAALAKYRGQIDSLDRSLKVQKADLSAASKEQTAANSALVSAEKVLARVEKAAAKFSSSGVWTNAARSALSFAQAEVSAAKQSASSAGSNYARLKSELESLSSARSRAVANAASTAQSERALRAEAEKAASANRRASAALEEGRSAYKGIQTSAAQASAALGGVSIDQASIASATAKANAELARSQKLLETLSRYSAGAGMFADPKTADAQRKMRAEMTRVQEGQRALQDEARRLSAALKAGTGDVDANRSALSRVVTAAGQAKSEYESLSASLAKIQGSARGSFAALDQVDGGLKKVTGNASAMQKLAEETARANAETARMKSLQDALSRYSTGGSASSDPKNAEAQRKLRAELEKVSAAQKTLQDEARRLAIAVKAGTGDVDANRAALSRVVAAAGQAKAEFEGLNASLARLQGSARGSFAALDQVDGGLKRVTGNTSAMQKLADTMSRFSNGAGGFTSPAAAAAIAKQRVEVDAARNAYAILSAEVSRLQSAMASSSPPTAAQAARLREVSQAAQAAQKELARQEATLNQLGGAGGRMAGFWSMFNSEGRRAMDISQRLRGEVLSLATAYLGFYNALQQIGGVIDAYRKLEAAQNRLGAVFKQNSAAVRSEMLWLERQASRLGIEFGSLSDEYGKFAVATDAAGFSGAATRKIFLSLAEAGRVNKLSADQMSGAFLALQQMISKGKVSSEELSRQLGDRLPGAVNIFATAIGKTTAELSEMLKKGEVFSDQTTMIKFADELNKRFGGQLSASLLTVTTLMGQFSNEIYQAQLRVGEGGFMESFASMLQELVTYFRSREGRDFFLSIGAALGNATNALKILIENIGLLTTLFKLLIAYKVAAWFVGIAGVAGTTLPVALATARASMSAFMASLASTTTGLATARTAATAFGAALNRIPVVLAISAAMYAVTELLSGWVSSVDAATSAMDRHKQTLEQVLTDYDNITRSGKNWAANLSKVTLDTVNADVRQLEEAVKDTKAEATRGWALGITNIFSADMRNAAYEVNRLKTALSNGSITAQEYREKLEQVYSKQTSEAAQKYIEDQLKIARRLEATNKALVEAAIVARDFGSNLPGLSNIIGNVAGSLDELANGLQKTGTNGLQAAADLKVYKDNLNELKKMVPSLKTQIQQMADEMQIEQLFQEALKKIPNGRGAIGQMNTLSAARDRALSVTRGTDTETKFDEIAKNTKLTASTISAVAKTSAGISGATATKADLEKFGTDFEAALKQVSDLIKVPMTDAMKAALASVQMGTGALGTAAGRAAIVDPLNAGKYAQAQKGIASFQGGGARRQTEATQFASQGLSSPEILASNYELQKKITDKIEEAKQKTKETIADNDLEIRQLELKLEDRALEAEILAAQAAARKENKLITDDELEIIRQQVVTQHELNKALAEEKGLRKNIREAESTVSNLDSARNSLIRQRDLLQKRGDQPGAEALDPQIAAIETKLRAAIATAMEFWAAMGGEQAQAAIERLRVMNLELDNTAERAAITGDQLNQMVAGQATDAISGFVEDIASGENAIDSLANAFRKFAADFLIQIGQMILQQMILNALQSMGFGSGGAGLIGSILHEGGTVGSSGGSRSVNAGVFAGAARYHSGGVIGLKPNEVPVIAERGEEMLTEDDPRHRKNISIGQQAPLPTANVRIVNVIDSAEMLKSALSSSKGEKVFVNYIRSNSETVRTAQGE